MNRPPNLLFLLSFGHMCTDIVQGALPALLPFLKDRFSLSYAVTGSILMAAQMINLLPAAGALLALLLPLPWTFGRGDAP